MAGHQCYHCKQWIADDEPHDCWTTTESALTADLSDDLREAWERLRETAVEFGDQRIYASHHSIMFSRTSCYFFVRPKRTYLEVCIFLGRPLRGPLVRRSTPSSSTKFANLLRIVHRDQVEAPLTDWLHDAYAQSERLRAARGAAPQRTPSGRATTAGSDDTTSRGKRANTRPDRSVRSRRTTARKRPSAKRR